MDEISNSVMTQVVSDDSTSFAVAPKLLESRGVNALWSFTRRGRRFFAKGLAPDFSGDLRARAMLEKEFDLAVRLDHPSIVRCLDWEALPESGECIVMEWIDGETLGKWLDTRRSISERARVALDICDALAYAVEKGVCHRDLKPDNIMITRSGQRVKIIDFGMGDSDDYALLKMSLGTRSFGAPEQQDSPVACGPEADVYSFGRILEFLGLSGRYYRVVRACRRENPAERPDMPSVFRMMRRADRLARSFLLIVLSLVAVLSLAFGVFRSLTPRREVAAPREATVQRDTVYMASPQTMKTDTLYIGEENITLPQSGQGPQLSDAENPAEGRRFTKASDRASECYDKAVAKIDALSEKYYGLFKSADTQRQLEIVMQFNNEAETVRRQFESDLKAAGERPIDISTYTSSLSAHVARRHPAALQ